jgi:hypothetical protein
MNKNIPQGRRDAKGPPKSRHLAEDLGPHSKIEFNEEVDALFHILQIRHLISVDELAQEMSTISDEGYRELDRTGRVINSITNILLCKGLITEAELQVVLDKKRASRR